MLFVLEALIAEGDARRALDLARRVHWFADAPAVTTMPENFYPPDALDAGGWNIGSASSSHGWGAYGLVLPALLMGLEATAPGFTSFTIRPGLGAIAQLAITVSTPSGPIKLSYHCTGEAPDLSVDAPPGVPWSADLSQLNQNRIRLNGELVPESVTRI